jgi:hypothetical protein
MGVARREQGRQRHVVGSCSEVEQHGTSELDNDTRGVLGGNVDALCLAMPWHKVSEPRDAWASLNSQCS